MPAPAAKNRCCHEVISQFREYSHSDEQPFFSVTGAHGNRPNDVFASAPGRINVPAVRRDQPAKRAATTKNSTPAVNMTQGMRAADSNRAS